MLFEIISYLAPILSLGNLGLLLIAVCLILIVLLHLGDRKNSSTHVKRSSTTTLVYNFAYILLLPAVITLLTFLISMVIPCKPYTGGTFLCMNNREFSALLYAMTFISGLILYPLSIITTPISLILFYSLTVKTSHIAKN